MAVRSIYASNEHIREVGGLSDYKLACGRQVLIIELRRDYKSRQPAQAFVHLIKNISGRTGNVIVQGSELTAGMYLYALIADGKVIDTKRMILTK